MIVGWSRDAEDAGVFDHDTRACNLRALQISWEGNWEWRSMLKVRMSKVVSFSSQRLREDAFPRLGIVSRLLSGAKI